MNQKILLLVSLYNNPSFITNSLDIIKDFENTDILIIDEGSTDDTSDQIEEYPWIKYIKHERYNGIGASFATGFKYAEDMGYDVVITLDSDNSNFSGDIQALIKNLNYGYDIVTCSRILENYNHSSISDEYIQTTIQISEAVKDTTNYDLTDPLSGIKAFQLKSLNNMELTEFDHGFLLQLWIQAAYFGLSVLEIPAISGETFGRELDQYEDPQGYFLSIIETEKFLYKKGTVN